MTVRRWMSVVSVSALLAGCAVDSGPAPDEPGDGRDDVFLIDGKADTGGVVEGTPEALGVINLVNTASHEVLDDDVPLDRRAADNIVYYRLGDDQQAGTSDDESFDTLAELDAVPWVGPVAFQRLLEYAKENGFVDDGSDGDGDGDGTTVVIGPPDLRGYIDVSVAASNLADWSPSNPPTYGPSNALTYAPAVYHVYKGSTKVASADVGNRAFLPKGRYIVAVNDTKARVTVEAGETTSVAAGRLEVSDVNGTFDVTVQRGDFSNGTQLFDEDSFPTGIGLNLMPGPYTVEVDYQAHTKRFDVTVEGGEITLVEPNDLRGHFVLEAPSGASHPSWSPSAPPTFGPSNAHAYENDTYHVYKGSELLETKSLGEAFYGPEGRYTVALNDTKTNFRIRAGETTTLRASRLEVADVDGTFDVTVPAGDFSNGTQLFDEDAFPTGVGFNVVGGEYTVAVDYQAHTKRFEVDLPAGNTHVVQPDDLRGHLVVRPPTGATLGDWSPANPPTFGPSNAHAYDNSVYHIYKGSTHLGTAALGEPFFAPEGNYTVALNDTKTSMSIVAGETTSVRAGRIEVNDVDGTYAITARAGDFSNGTQVLDEDEIPTGVGLNVMPGSYTVEVDYQTHTNSFDITVPN